MAASLDVDGNAVCARVGEFRQVTAGLGHHEVNVKRQGGGPAHSTHARRAEAEVRGEDAVHDVDVDGIRAAVFGSGNLFSKMADVGGENRWRDADGASA